MSHAHAAKPPPAALSKPPLPGRERIVLRLLVLLALILMLLAPLLPELADRPRLGPYFAHPVEPHLAKPGVRRDPGGERPDEAAVPAGGYPDAGGFLNVSA